MAHDEHIHMVAEALELIDTHLTSPINVNQICQVSSLSKWQFQRVFKKYVGESIGRYLRRRRLFESYERILNTTQLNRDRIIDIAIEYQFGSNEAFTRSFNSEFGINPSFLRNKSNDLRIYPCPQLTLEHLKFLNSNMDKNPRIKNIHLRTFYGVPLYLNDTLEQNTNHQNFLEKEWSNFASTLSALNIPASGSLFELRFPIEDESFQKESYFDYLLSTDLDQSTHDLKTFKSYTLSVQLHAEFVFYGTASTLLRDYIYGIWLPQSSYKRQKGPDIVITEVGLNRSKYLIPVEIK